MVNIKPYKGPRTVIESTDYPGEVIHVAKRVYEGIQKKAQIISTRVVGGYGGKVVIEYKPKKGTGYGVLELNDMGPQPTKN